jgi:AcrR family transcriptional regulator
VSNLAGRSPTSSTTTQPSTRAGRPRQAATDRKILDATRELLVEGGVRALAVERVAARSGVAKTTIYRRYRSKNELALAVLIDMVRTVAAVPDLGDTRAELTRFVRATLKVLAESLMGRIMQGLVSELAVDAELALAFRDRVVALRMSEVRRIIQRGQQRGDVRVDAPVDLVHDMLFGPMYYRLLLSGAPLERGLADAIVNAIYPTLLENANASRRSAATRQPARS